MSECRCLLRVRRPYGKRCRETSAGQALAASFRSSDSGLVKSQLWLYPLPLPPSFPPYYNPFLGAQINHNPFPLLNNLPYQLSPRRAFPPVSSASTMVAPQQFTKVDLTPRRHHGYAVFLFILGTLFPPLGKSPFPPVRNSSRTNLPLSHLS